MNRHLKERFKYTSHTYISLSLSNSSEQIFIIHWDC